MPTVASIKQQQHPVFSTFRDPSGTLVQRNGEVLRIITPEGLSGLQTFLQSRTHHTLVTEGSLIGTSILSDRETKALLQDPSFAAIYQTHKGQLVLRHPKVWFPSLPYEWPPEMLFEAAELTLRLAELTLQEGFGLKDATPFNILFDKGRPIFVDVLSFEARDPNDPTWLPCAQFIRTFLLPLALEKHKFPWTTQSLLSRHEGLEPEDVYVSLSWPQKLSRDFLTSCSIPTWLTRGNRNQLPSLYQKKAARSSEEAQYVLESLFRSLRKSLARLRPSSNRSSKWSSYGINNTYSTDQFTAKLTFVEEAFREYGLKRVLDIGSNEGRFSRLAAKYGVSVVAIDSDTAVVSRLWQQVHQESLDILPLAIDLARPTPAAGWGNQEFPSFLERAHGSFDGVLMLAVLHHLLVTERIPLPSILALAASLTKSLLVIELIESEDPMFRALSRGRDNLYPPLSSGEFEQACKSNFHIVRSFRLPDSHRVLYVLRKRHPY